MTHHPTPDTAEAPAPPAQSSANGTRPKSALLAAPGPARTSLDAERPAAGLNGGQRVVDLDVAARPADLHAAERAAAALLTALGIDLDREERQATPGRMARAYAELLAAQPFRLTTFPNDEGYDELVLARAIPSASITCCSSLASRMSATCPGSASSGFPSWPAWSSTSPPSPRRRNG